MENTITWDKYQRGRNHQSKTSLLPKIDKNERFYSVIVLHLSDEYDII